MDHDWEGRRCFTGCFRVHRICMDIALHKGGQDSPCVPWHMVLVIKPKPNVPVVETSGLWSCFQIYNQDQGQQVTLLGVGLFFKTASFVLRLQWDFTISWIAELGDPQKHFCLWTDAKLLFLRRGYTVEGCLMRPSCSDLFLWVFHTLAGNGGETET